MSTENIPSDSKQLNGPKFLKSEQWDGYPNPAWLKKDKKKVTLLFNFVEQRKSFFLQAYFHRHGFIYKDLGPYLRRCPLGKEYGNRMECNPMYFTSGSIIKNLFQIQKETGLTKEEIVNKYVFLGGGGQCGPCRYGMYPQEYLKAINDAGFKGFRILIFSSDIIQDPMPKGSAFTFSLAFKIDILISVILADFIHIAECALRPYAKDKEQALAVLSKAEEILLEAFKSPLYLIKLPEALKKVSKMIADVPRKNLKLPKIYVTGEFFANLAHNEGNYNLRRFIMDEGCEYSPAFLHNVSSMITETSVKDSWNKIRCIRNGTQISPDCTEKTECKYLNCKLVL